MIQDKCSKFTRRRLLRAGGAVGTFTLLAGTGMRVAAQGQEKVDPSSQMAQSLNYVENAENAQARQNPGAYCHNCRYYTAGGGEEGWGPCTIFSNKLVAAEGWCSAWAERA